MLVLPFILGGDLKEKIVANKKFDALTADGSFAVHRVLMGGTETDKIGLNQLVFTEGADILAIRCVLTGASRAAPRRSHAPSASALQDVGAWAGDDCAIVWRAAATCRRVPGSVRAAPVHCPSHTFRSSLRRIFLTRAAAERLQSKSACSLLLRMPAAPRGRILSVGAEAPPPPQARRASSRLRGVRPLRMRRRRKPRCPGSNRHLE